MKIRHFKNDRGITLVELLAAISLFSIIVVLSSTFLLQILNSEESTSNKIQLTQETNVLINELRSAYHKGDFKLCFSIPNGLTMSDKSFDHHFSYKELKIVNGEKELTTAGGCIDTVDTKEPLSIRLTANDNNGQDLTVESTFTNYRESVLIRNQETWANIVDNKDPLCVYEGNTLFRGKDTNKIQLKNNRCERVYKVNGSAWLSGKVELTNHVKLIISNNLYILDDEFLRSSNGDPNNGKVCVSGEVYFPDTISKQSQKIYEHIFNCD
jgi:prepilin-type N-terminal cleavage/methylation domain-containing protein